MSPVGEEGRETEKWEKKALQAGESGMNSGREKKNGPRVDCGRCPKDVHLNPQNL